MEQKVSVCVIERDSKDYLEKVFSALEENEEFIEEVIYTGKEEDIPDTDLDVKSLNLSSENQAFLRNQALKHVNAEWILWIDTATELEDSTIEELFDLLEEYPDANLIYTNAVKITKDGEENVINYDNLYENKYIVLQGLTVDKYFPEWGILTKKEIFNKNQFNENFKEYEFYEFFLKNLQNLRPALSDLSFINFYEAKTFIDTSYMSKILRDLIIDRYLLEKLFPHLSWDENKEVAQSTAYTMIGDALANYHDLYNATDYYRKALLSFHNKHTLTKLIKSYVDMGLFENAKQLLSSEQGLTEEEIKSTKQDIEKVEKLIKGLEKGVEEGKIDEVLYALNDVIDIYQGAPVYNIAGVVQFYRGDLEGAYRFFYKAVVLNPLEENILRNLTDVAKQLGREKEVVQLIERLLK